MAGFAAKLHLPIERWPELDKALWRQAVEADDPLAMGAAARLSAASRTRYLMGWRRLLGYLAITEPEVLEESPADRLRPDRMKRFAKHLGMSCSPRSVATGVEAAYHAARVMMPDLDLGWLKRMKTRLHCAVPPKPETRPAITSLQLLNLGLEMMEEVRPKLGTRLSQADAVQYRDGLMIALTAFAPLRRKNLAALDMIRHLQLGHEPFAVVIPVTESKTAVAIEFEIDPSLVPYFRDYCTFVRSRLKSDVGCTALWIARRGKKLSYASIWAIFARHSSRRLGLRLCPHDVRAAAATTWGIFSPDQIGVARELLAHKDIRTTTEHYNRAGGIQASRAHFSVLRKLRQSPHRR